MKITLENTNVLVQVSGPQGSVPGRLWMGKTDTGIPVQCVITRIAVQESENLEQFERELMECRPPEAGPIAFPLRRW
jgi:hypothetical protein